MAHIEFFMPMAVVPTTTHQMQSIGVRNGKPYVYEPAQVKNARQKFMAHLSAHIPEVPLEGAISLMVKWCFQADKKHPPNTWRTTRPDTDNLSKMLKDCMTACHFWKDDAQVAQEITEKFWWDKPGIFIRISSLEEDHGILE